MQPVLRLLKVLSQVPMIVASVALFALMVLTFADVLMRSILSYDISTGFIDI